MEQLNNTMTDMLTDVQANAIMKGYIIKNRKKWQGGGQQYDFTSITASKPV